MKIIDFVPKTILLGTMQPPHESGARISRGCRPLLLLYPDDRQRIDFDCPEIFHYAIDFIDGSHSHQCERDLRFLRRLQNGNFLDAAKLGTTLGHNSRQFRMR